MLESYIGGLGVEFFERGGCLGTDKCETESFLNGNFERHIFGGQLKVSERWAITPVTVPLGPPLDW